MARNSHRNGALTSSFTGSYPSKTLLELRTSIATNTAKTLGIGAALMVLLFISTAVLRWLWNTTVPNVFNLNAITFWQCFRLLIMVKILLVGGSGIIKAM